MIDHDVSSQPLPKHSVPSAAPRRPHHPPGLREYRVFTCHSPADAAPYVASWDKLASQTPDPNPFYESWMLLPALSIYGASNIEIALVLESDPNAGGRIRVVGVFPIEHLRTFRGLPICTTRLWKQPHCYLCTPLIAENARDVCWHTLIDWLRDSRGSSIFQLPTQNLDGSFFQGILEDARSSHLTLQMEGLHTRALFQVATDATTYIQRIGTCTRKTIRQNRQRLAAKGNLRVTGPQTGQDIHPWLDQFLELESRGWKGAAGTAMRCRTDDRDYFRQVCLAAHQRNKLTILSLELDGRSIAMQIDLHAGEGAVGWKIAYDEQYSRLSPGTVLAFEAITRSHADRRAQWIDCGSTPDNDSMRHLWAQRRVIADILIPTGRPMGHLLLSLLPVAQYLRGYQRQFTAACGRCGTAFRSLFPSRKAADSSALSKRLTPTPCSPSPS